MVETPCCWTMSEPITQQVSMSIQVIKLSVHFMAASFENTCSSIISTELAVAFTWKGDVHASMMLIMRGQHQHESLDFTSRPQTWRATYSSMQANAQSRCQDSILILTLAY